MNSIHRVAAREADAPSSAGWMRWGAALAAIGCLSVPAQFGWCGWQTFTSADGLAANFVSSILEDRSGNLWFGNYNGALSCYDGVTWRTYTTADGLPSNAVFSIFEDRTGKLWFGTDSGVVRYDGTTWRTFTTADGLASNIVASILEDRSGNLWFGTELGVSRYDGATWRTFTTADGLGNNIVWSIVEDRSGNLWFGTADENYTGTGVSRYDGTTWQTFGFATGEFSPIVEDRSGNLWFGTSGGVLRYDGTTWQTFTNADMLTVGGFVSSMIEDRSGNLWVGLHGGGVSRYNGVSWRNFTTADGLADNIVLSVVEDGSGNLWVGTQRGGVSRYDGSSWRYFTTADGLAHNNATSIAQDRSESLWFGTGGGGVSRYYGAIWRTFTTADGLASNDVRAILEDRSGNLWFGTGGGGVSRYDGATWRTFTTADGLASDFVFSILEDRSGNFWFGTFGGGVTRYDGTTWQTFTTADGLANNYVYRILEDRSGSLWFAYSHYGFPAGVTRYDGATWRTFTTADGLAHPDVQSILEDRAGNLWFGTFGAGVTRYDGATWKTFRFGEEAQSNCVLSIVEDRTGSLWFGNYSNRVHRYDGANWRTFTIGEGRLPDTYITLSFEDARGNLWFGASSSWGVATYENDFVPPQTVFLSAPPRVTAAREHGSAFVAAFGETQGIEFSHRLDGGPWSDWSRVGSAFLTALTQGLHVLEARSRDFLWNMDQTPALALFEVDADPPVPIISSPAFSAPVRAEVGITGTTADARFSSYRLEYRTTGSSSWAGIVASATPISSGLLGSWNTSSLPDGSYDLRLSVSDSLGLVGTVITIVTVDNHAPFLDETAPAKVPAATGGDVYTTNAETHLYFPPHAFAQDAIVMVTAATAGSVPASLPSGGVKVLDGYELGWAGTLKKQARFTMSYAGASLPTGTLALYRSADGTSWERLGGTVDADARSVSLGVSQPGRYALFADNGLGAGTASLSPIAFTPRVFSPTGGFADQQVGISFRLGKPAPVTVKIFSRSGRLIREVVMGQAMGAGDNMIRWDGVDRNGGYVVDGMYLVTVEAMGQTQTKTLAVVK